jgi:hypothetical protein
MKTVTNLHGINIVEEIEKYCCSQREYESQTLAEIVQKYDFVVASEECKRRLMEVLPEGANIICCPYIDSQTAAYAIKKIDDKRLRILLKGDDNE